MRIQLDDNQRNAFQYLLGGVVVVLVIRGSAWLLKMMGPRLDEEQVAVGLFQHDYPLLSGEWATVATGAGILERLMLAVVVAVGITFALGVVLVIANKARSPLIGRGGMLAMRATLFVVLAWNTYGVVMLPIKETRPVHDGLLIKERRALVGDIPWPLPATERKIPGAELLRVEAGSDHPGGSKKVSFGLDVVTPAGSERIGQLNAVDHTRELRTLQLASEAAAAMEREAH